MDIVDGHPTGSVRISFGYMSTMEDARKFVEFIEDTFLRPVRLNSTASLHFLHNIYFIFIVWQSTVMCVCTL